MHSWQMFMISCQRNVISPVTLFECKQNEKKSKVQALCI